MRQIFKIFILSIFFLSVYFFLFWSGIIKYLALGSSYYFGDYELFKNALSCVNKGLSPYNGPPELNCKGYNYGYVLLVLMPFKDFIVNANEFTLPIFLTTIFIIFSVQILNPKNYFQFFVCLLALLNPATLLLIERMNLDLLLYLIIIILAFNKIYFLNWLLVAYSFLFKFHPFIYGIIIFVEKEKRKLKNLLLIFFFILIISILSIYIYREEYTLMFIDSGSWKMGLHYLYSIKTIPKILKESFSFHYGLMLLIIYILFIFQITKRVSKYEIHSNYDFEKKLFLLSSNSLLFCFITFSNAFYREVFLVLTIPYLLANIKDFKNVVYLICFKFLFNFIYTIDLNFETFYHVDDIRIYKAHFLMIVFLKGVIDYILMLFIGSIAFRMNLDLLKKINKNIIRN